MDFTSSYASSTADFSATPSYIAECKSSAAVRRRPKTVAKKLTIISPEDIANFVSPLERTFQILTSRWKTETRHLSSPTEIAMHPAYQRIIGLGPSVMPLVIAELNHEPDWWFWALRAITGVDPVRDKDRGRLAAMTRAWLQWWETEGVAERWKV